MSNTIVSLTNYEWLLPSNNSQNSLLDQILINRGIDRKDKKLFLEKKYDQLETSDKIKHIKKANKLLNRHFLEKNLIIIFGDYDADGIPASVLLELFLIKLGCQVEVIIPDRKDGYGLTKFSTDRLIDLNPKLIITIDNGTNSPELIGEIVKKDIDVIVIDHHEISVTSLPEAIIINPKQQGDKSSAQILTAGGLVFKFIQNYINIYFKNDQDWLKWLKWQLDLVAVSTVCDVAPLVGENRILVDKGIIVLKQNRRYCFQKLFLTNSLDPQKISTYTLGFIIGPRINATGRMGDSNLGYKFLKSDAHDSDKYTKIVNNLNSQRQLLFSKCLEEAKHMLEDSIDDKAIVLYSPNWSEGIIGLIAAKLCEEFYKPVFIFSQNKNILVGSARSIDGVNLVALLEDTKDYLEKFGGHEKAAGLALDQNNFEIWKKTILKKMNKYDKNIFVKKIFIDYIMKLSKISESVVDELTSLEPYGMGNPQPIFFDITKINNIQLMGREKNHLKFQLISENKIVEAIAFNKTEWLDKIKIGKEYAIIYQIDKSDWPGRMADIKIKDIANYG